jgi:Rieske Fe-S protein
VNRRGFLRSCAAVGGVAPLAGPADAWADAPRRSYPRARLVDVNGQPIAAARLVAHTNYLFHYPYAGTPCFLLNLARPVAGGVTLQREDGSSYGWPGGVGPGKGIVAYSAICAHKLAYPAREVSFIRYRAAASPNGAAKVIHCCAEHSVYDPAAGARVVAGPAPQPLAAILLDYDAVTDALFAIGTVGAEQFEAFFAKYDFRLAMEFGQGRARQPVADRAIVREMTQYCRQTVEC